MTAPELLPCPFCGCTTIVQARAGVACYYNVCDWCGSEGPAEYPDSDTPQGWNVRTPSPEVAALIAEARREDAKLLLDAYKGVLVLMRILNKAGLVAGASAADQISKRIVDAHPEFPGMASLRALKEETP